eukprot:Gb_16819 [translate_table: standard]
MIQRKWKRLIQRKAITEKGEKQGRIRKRLQTLHQRKEMLEEVPFNQREVNVRKEKTTTVLSVFKREPEVKSICQEVGLGYIFSNCGHFDLESVEQFVKRYKDRKTWVNQVKIAVTKGLVAKLLRVPSDGQQALQEKGRPSEFKNLVEKKHWREFEVKVFRRTNSPTLGRE